MNVALSDWSDVPLRMTTSGREAFRVTGRLHRLPSRPRGAESLHEYQPVRAILFFWPPRFEAFRKINEMDRSPGEALREHLGMHSLVSEEHSVLICVIKRA
jgi:hypothetical protein